MSDKKLLIKYQFPVIHTDVNHIVQIFFCICISLNMLTRCYLNSPYTRRVVIHKTDEFTISSNFLVNHWYESFRFASDQAPQNICKYIYYPFHPLVIFIQPSAFTIINKKKNIKTKFVKQRDESKNQTVVQLNGSLHPIYPSCILKFFYTIIYTKELKSKYISVRLAAPSNKHINT